jgi:hypothetical protein
LSKRPIWKWSIAAFVKKLPVTSRQAAEQTLMWLPIETAVAALARAREADRTNDRIACDGALAEVLRVMGR